MGEWRQVAGAAQRSVLAHDRHDACVQHVRVRLCDDGTHAGPACTQRGQTQEHERADDFFLDLRSGARGVRAHERQLQLGSHLLRDVATRQRAESSRDAVDRRGILGEFLDALTRRLDFSNRLGSDFYLRAVAGDGDDLVDGQCADADGHGLGSSSVGHIWLLIADYVRGRTTGECTPVHPGREWMDFSRDSQTRWQ